MVASAEDVAAVLGVLLLLSETGKLAEAGIAPSLMAAAGAPGCGGGGEVRERESRGEKEVNYEYAGLANAWV